MPLVINRVGRVANGVSRKPVPSQRHERGLPAKTRNLERITDMSRTFKDRNDGMGKYAAEAYERAMLDTQFAKLLGFYVDPASPVEPADQAADHVRHVLDRGQ